MDTYHTYDISLSENQHLNLHKDLGFTGFISKEEHFYICTVYAAPSQ
jgi:hypothetical protein